MKAPAPDQPKLKKKVKVDAAPAAPAKKGFPPRKTGAAAKRPAKKPVPVTAAPADFKPHFLEVVFRTERDGLPGASVRMTRVNGSYNFDDPESIDDKKKVLLTGYDANTAMGVYARIASVLFRSNADKKYPSAIKDRNKTEKYKHEASGETRTRLVYRTAHRLPSLTQFLLVLRVNKRKNDGSISVVRRKIYQYEKNAKGRVVLTLLDNKDPVYRAISRAAKILPPAFKNVLQPPKRERGQRVKKDADEE